MHLHIEQDELSLFLNSTACLILRHLYPFWLCLPLSVILTRSLNCECSPKACVPRACSPAFGTAGDGGALQRQGLEFRKGGDQLSKLCHWKHNIGTLVPFLCSLIRDTRRWAAHAPPRTPYRDVRFCHGFQSKGFWKCLKVWVSRNLPSSKLVDFGALSWCWNSGSHRKSASLGPGHLFPAVK